MTSLKDYPYAFEHLGSQAQWSRNYNNVENMLKKVRAISVTEVRCLIADVCRTYMVCQYDKLQINGTVFVADTLNFFKVYIDFSPNLGKHLADFAD